MPKKVFLKKRRSAVRRKEDRFFAFRLAAAAVAIAVCFAFGAFIKNSLAQSWSEPTETPPGNNVLPPIWNQNSSAQSGSMYLSGSARFDASNYGNSYCSLSKLCAADAGAAWALVGESNSGYGVYAASVSSYGLYAASASNYAGYFSGPVYVSGSLSTTGAITQGGKAVCLSDGTNCAASGGGFWTASGNDIYNTNSGKVGIGVNNPNNKIQVAGLINFEPTLFNTYLGVDAGSANTSGASNAGVGASSMWLNTTGVENTAVGTSSLGSNTTGRHNTAVGFEAGYNCCSTPSLQTVSDSTFLGYKANAAADGISNSTAIGYGAQAALSNQIVIGSGSIYYFKVRRLINFDSDLSNTFMGFASGLANTSGYYNTSLGYNAFASNLTGNNSTAVGTYAMFYNSSGQGNTAIGNSALFLNTSGGGNTAIGFDANRSNTTGLSNTSVGQSALYSNTSGTENVAIGGGSLYANATGYGNVAVGIGAGQNGSTPLPNMTNSIFIGTRANSTVDAIDNSIAIGWLAQVTKSNQVVIGNASVTETVLRGTVVSQAKPNVAFSPADPTGRASTTGVMMGFSNGVTRITPASSGKVLITISGMIGTSNAAGQPSVILYYGSGNGPANNAALTGTAVGTWKTMYTSSATNRTGFAITGVVSGLTLGTGYWIDAAVKTNNASYTSTIYNVDVTAIEL